MEVRSEPHPSGTWQDDPDIVGIGLGPDQGHCGSTITNPALGDADYNQAKAWIAEEVRESFEAERFEEALRWLLKEFPADQV